MMKIIKPNAVFFDMQLKKNRKKKLFTSPLYLVESSLRFKFAYISLPLECGPLIATNASTYGIAWAVFFRLQSW